MSCTLGDGGGTYRCGKVDSVPAAIELCCKSGQEANTGGTGCWSEWGKMNGNYHKRSIFPDHRK